MVCGRSVSMVIVWEECIHSDCLGKGYCICCDTVEQEIFMRQYFHYILETLTAKILPDMH